MSQLTNNHPEPGHDLKTESASVPNDSSLPNVLIIGDSISEGYTPFVREELKGSANVQRIPENGATSRYGLEKLDTWLGDEKWDLIHFNHGLHDIKVMEDGNRQVESDEYEANLRQLAQKLATTGAHLIWASTTPVPDAEGLNPLRRSGDEVAYNIIAQKIMTEQYIPINDLYALAHAQLAEIQTPANVHFTDEGYKILGQQVAAQIRTALA